MKSRPDSPAILSLIGLAGLLVLGWIILSALGKTVPAEAWVAISTLAGIVGGWVGKTLTSEAAPTVDVAEPIPAPAPEPAQPELEVHPPARNDRAERQRISDYLAGDQFVAGPDVDVHR